jgi:hypothetical protein
MDTQKRKYSEELWASGEAPWKMWEIDKKQIQQKKSGIIMRVLVKGRKDILEHCWSQYCSTEDMKLRS